MRVLAFAVALQEFHRCVFQLMRGLLRYAPTLGLDIIVKGILGGPWRINMRLWNSFCKAFHFAAAYWALN